MEGDLTSLGSVLGEQRPSTVFHLAAQTQNRHRSPFLHLGGEHPRHLLAAGGHALRWVGVEGRGGGVLRQGLRRPRAAALHRELGALSPPTPTTCRRRPPISLRARTPATYELPVCRASPGQRDGPGRRELGAHRAWTSHACSFAASGPCRARTARRSATSSTWTTLLTPTWPSGPRWSGPGLRGRAWNAGCWRASGRHRGGAEAPGRGPPASTWSPTSGARGMLHGEIDRQWLDSTRHPRRRAGLGAEMGPGQRPAGGVGVVRTDPAARAPRMMRSAAGSDAQRAASRRS